MSLPSGASPWMAFLAGSKGQNITEHTYSSYVRIRDVALKTCQRRLIIRRSGERRSGISVLAARHDDDDDEGHSWFNRVSKVFQSFQGASVWYETEAVKAVEGTAFGWVYRGNWCANTLCICSFCVWFKSCIDECARYSISGTYTFRVWTRPWRSGINKKIV